MYNYTLNTFQTSNEQLLRKHCFVLDQTISAIVNFIDTINPNYIVLNVNSTAGSETFYPSNFITTTIVNTSEGYIDISKMWPHQIIVNNYKQDLNIYSSLAATEPLGVLNEGFALIKLNSNQDTTSYSIVSLDSSGTYYVLNNIIINNSGKLETQWLYYPNATDEIGQEYIFSLTPPGTRFIYWSQSEGDGDINTYKNISISPNYVFTQAYNANTLDPSIASIKGSFWNNYILLGYDIHTASSSASTYIIEDIICDSIMTTRQIVLNRRPVSSSETITNLKSCSGVNFYINYY